MKSIKRTMAMCAAATLVFSAMTVVPASAAESVSVKVTPSAETVEAGDEITLTFDLTNAPSGLGGFSFDVDYDKTIFEFVPSSDGNYPYIEVPSNITSTAKKNAYIAGVMADYAEQGKYVMGQIVGNKDVPTGEDKLEFRTGLSGEENITDSGEILELTFKVKEGAKAGEYNFVIDPESENYSFYQVDPEAENVEGEGGTEIPATITNAKVTVKSAEVAPTEIVADNMELADIGLSKAIGASVNPTNATNKDLTYKSKDETIATVDSTGKVTAKGVGETTITITAAGASAVTKTIKVTVNHTTHTLEKVAAVEATCTKEGNIEYYKCTDCGKLFSDAAGKNEIKLSDTVVAKKAHDFTKKDTSAKYLKSAATCTKPAEYYYSCSVCGEKGTETFTYGDVDKTKHGDTKVVGAKEATYDEEGYTGDTVCADCGEIIEKGTTIPVKEPTLVPEKAPTCLEDGYKAHYERDDGTIWDKDDKTVELSASDIRIPATGHDWAEPTYTFSADYSKCTAKRVCKNDSTHVEEEPVETTETVIKEPTYEEKGLSSYTAVFENKAFETQTVEAETPAKVHTYEAVDAKEPTCEEDGNKAYYVRDDGLLFEDMAGTKETTAEAVKIPALGHDYELTAVELSEDNSKIKRTYICKNDKTHTYSVEADTVEASRKDATCKEEGEVVYEADFSEAKDGSDVEQITVAIEKLEHDWSDWTVTKEATVDEEGEETRTCAICGETETRAIPKLTDETSEGENKEDPKKNDSKNDTPKKDDTKKDDANKGNTANNTNGTATSNPVTGTAAALGVVAAALGSLAIFKKRK